MLNSPSIQNRSFYLLGLLIFLYLIFGAGSFFQDFRDDDWTYLYWGRHTTGLFGWLFHPPPFPYRRPLNALVWYLQAKSGPDYWGPAQSILLILWLGCGLRVYKVAKGKGDTTSGILALIILLSLPSFRDLISWRSWLTLTGALFGFLSAWNSITRSHTSVSGLPILLWLAFGAGFREDIWFYGALLMLGHRYFRLSFICLLCLLLQIQLSNIENSSFSLSHPIQNTPLLIHSIAQTPLIALIIGLPLCWKYKHMTLIAIFGTIGCLPSILFYIPKPAYFLIPMVVMSVILAQYLSEAYRSRDIPLTLCLSLGFFTLLLPKPWQEWSENIHFQQYTQSQARLSLKQINPNDIMAVYTPDEHGPAVWLSQYLHTFHDLVQDTDLDPNMTEEIPHLWVLQHKPESQ